MKIKPYYRKRSGIPRGISSNVYVERTTERGNASFYSCVRVGQHKQRPGSSTRKECAYGKNPRQAIGKALKALGAKLSRQKGAFAGLK